MRCRLNTFCLIDRLCIGYIYEYDMNNVFLHADGDDDDDDLTESTY